MRCLDEAFAHQPVEGIAHRCDAGVEILREMGGLERSPGGEAAAVELPLEG